MISVAAQFSALTAEEIKVWNEFAMTYPAFNKLGEAYTPTGKQVFVLCNLNRASIGAGIISAPPFPVASVPSINITDVNVTAKVTAGPAPITVLTVESISSTNEDAIIVLQATPNMLPARQSYRNRMRQVGFDTQGEEQDIETAWKAYFGNPNVAVGQIINFRASALDAASGVASAWVYFQKVIAVGP